MRVLTVAVAFSFASVCGAQQALAPGVTQARPDPVIVLQDQTFWRGPSSCPVALRVRQKAQPPLLFTAAPAGARPAYVIDVQPRPGRRIREVAVRLTGPSGPHLELTGGGLRAADSFESFVLTSVTTTVVRTKTLTAVRWVDVVSVTYADGTSWHPADWQSCRVAPQGVWLLR